MVVLGVDGGATKTACVVIGENGAIHGSATAGGSNWNSSGPQEALKAIRQAITGALTNSNRTTEQVEAICLGLAGVNRPLDAQVLTTAVRDWFSPQVLIKVCNDAVTALASGTDGELSGCILIVGTGSIAYGICEDGAETWSSGWGPAFQDGGSGYDIGHRALGAVARAADGRGPATKLQQAICRHCRAPAAEDLIEWVYAEPGWARVASLAPLVVRCAEKGDSVAESILEAAVEELVSGVTAVVAKMGQPKAFRIVLAGGLVTDEQNRYFTGKLKGRIRDALPQAQLLHPKVDAEVGAALLAKNLMRASMTNGNGKINGSPAENLGFAMVEA